MGCNRSNESSIFSLTIAKYHLLTLGVYRYETSFCVNLQILDPEYRQATVVLLVCHRFGVSQHSLRGRGALSPAKMAQRIPL